MRLAEVFLPQLEREATISQRVLARVPEGIPEWKPHERSMPLGYLATLVATMPSWVGFTVAEEELDLSPPGGSSRPPAWTLRSELLEAHDRSVARAREVLQETSDAHLLLPWRLLVSGQVVMEQPRHVVIADTFCHLAHHRGQLSVYLRLNGVPVPSLYGPTADEPTF
jgi:uncharacterized damage-inducible protein DinB